MIFLNSINPFFTDIHPDIAKTEPENVSASDSEYIFQGCTDRYSLTANVVKYGA